MFEVSNNTIVTIALLALSLALLGTWFLAGRVEYTGLTSAPTGTITANVGISTDISLQISSVSFGSVSVGNTYDDTGNYSNASYFQVRNDGSANDNVTISASTGLFTTATTNDTSVRFKTNNVTGNTSITTNCPTINQNTWYAMPNSSSTIALCNFKFNTGNNYANVSIQITVPTGEPQGSKTQTVTFTATAA